MHHRLSGRAPEPSRSAVSLALLALLFGTAPAFAQDHDAADDPTPSRFSGALTLLTTQPQGEMTLGPGFGLGLSAAVALDPARRFRIRGDLRFAGYGIERRRACMGVPVGCLIEMDVNTIYSSIYVGAGPEVAVPLGGALLVLDATAGYGLFSVDSSVEGVNSEESMLNTNNFHDGFFSWSAGGELRVPVSRHVAVALGAHYQRNGRATYVLEGGIGMNPDGSLAVDARTSEANQAVLSLGVAVQPSAKRDEAGGSRR